MGVDKYLKVSVNLDMSNDNVSDVNKNILKNYTLRNKDKNLDSEFTDKELKINKDDFERLKPNQEKNGIHLLEKQNIMEKNKNAIPKILKTFKTSKTSETCQKHKSVKSKLNSEIQKKSKENIKNNQKPAQKALSFSQKLNTRNHFLKTGKKTVLKISNEIIDDKAVKICLKLPAGKLGIRIGQKYQVDQNKYKKTKFVPKVACQQLIWDKGFFESELTGENFIENLKAKFENKFPKK